VKPRNENPVVVAGGGIGGLAAALALARKGFRS
jgi:2-polyprenyl-6-methoxyphenol hydroxylase-like FAD-dependent oxidoreductase